MITTLQEIHTEIKTLRREIASEEVETIAKKTIRERTEKLGTRWFTDVSEELPTRFGISPDIVERYSQKFARLIKISAPNNLKKSYIETLTELNRHFRDDLIIPLQTRSKSVANPTLLDEILKGLPNAEENEYLNEAVNCAKHKFYRASVVLAWCATIDRIHRVVEKIGFAKFNITSSMMANQQKGRFKNFSSPQNISSISELRQTFDTIVLWILEGLQLIDYNQHTRLRSCFDLRCQCSHPGDAPVTEFNLLSYFSDLSEIVFKNPKFQV
jgi:hypothetical protein